MRKNSYVDLKRPSALAFYTLRPADLLLSFNVRNLKMNDGYKSSETFPLNWSKRCEQVMIAFMGMVLDDIIDEGVEFTYKGDSPTSARDFTLGVYELDIRTYKKCLDDGHMIKDFDPIQTGFKAYQLMIKYTDYHGFAKQIQGHVDSGRRARIAAKANAGMIRVTRQVTVDDYKDRICGMFPQFQRRGLCLLLNHTVKAITGAVKHHCHVLLTSHGTDKYPSLVLRLGKLTVWENVMIWYILRAMEYKIRYLYRHMYVLWDGVCYFALGEDVYEANREDIDAGRTVDYGDVLLTRVYDSSVRIAFQDKRKYIMRLEGSGIDMGVKFVKPTSLVTDKAVLYDTIEKFEALEMAMSKRKYQLLVNTNADNRMKVRDANLERMKNWKRKTRYMYNVVKNRANYTTPIMRGEERAEWERKMKDIHERMRERYRRRLAGRKKYREKKKEENSLAIWQRTEA